MENVNFIVVGHQGHNLLVVHKDDYDKIVNNPEIKGMKVELSEGKIFGPEKIDIWVKFISFEEVENDEVTQNLYHRLVERKLPDPIIENLIEVIEQNKYSSDGK